MSLLKQFAFVSKQYQKGKISKSEMEREQAAITAQAINRQIIHKKVQKAHGELVNLAEYESNPLEWFQSKRALENPLSVAEIIIRDILYKYPVHHYREVSFKGLKFTEHGYARYDFLIEVPGGIHIIEYDGIIAHSNPINLAKDKMKNEFCKKYGIPLTRYNKQHYYNLDTYIGKLLAGYGIKRK